jgi:hypothetical protein
MLAVNMFLGPDMLSLICTYPPSPQVSLEALLSVSGPKVAPLRPSMAHLNFLRVQVQSGISSDRAAGSSIVPLRFAIVFMIIHDC